MRKYILKIKVKKYKMETPFSMKKGVFTLLKKNIFFANYLEKCFNTEKVEIIIND